MHSGFATQLKRLKQNNCWPEEFGQESNSLHSLTPTKFPRQSRWDKADVGVHVVYPGGCTPGSQGHRCRLWQRGRPDTVSNRRWHGLVLGRRGLRQIGPGRQWWLQNPHEGEAIYSAVFTGGQPKHHFILVSLVILNRKRPECVENYRLDFLCFLLNEKPQLLFSIFHLLLRNLVIERDEMNS